MFNGIRELYQYRSMLRHLIRTDLRVRYKGSVLGFLWTFINPLVLIVVYTVVFSTILKVNIPNYTIYLAAGLLPWNAFQSSLSGSAGSIIRNAHLVTKIYFPRSVLPISVVLSNTVNYLYSMVIMMFAIAVFHVGVSWSLIVFPIALLIQIMIMIGLALLISAANVYFRDLEHIVTVFMMAWFYVTPIVYSLNLIPKPLVHWFYLNPMTSVIETYVDILYRGVYPSPVLFVYGGTWAIGLLILGWAVFTRLNKGFGEAV